jgi:hypothetical protein
MAKAVARSAGQALSLLICFSPSKNISFVGGTEGFLKCTIFVFSKFTFNALCLHHALRISNSNWQFDRLKIIAVSDSSQALVNMIYKFFVKYLI